MVVTSLHSRSQGPAPAESHGAGREGQQRGPIIGNTFTYPLVFEKVGMWRKKKGERKAQSKVLHKEESYKYGGDALKYGKGALKMTQGVRDKQTVLCSSSDWVWS